MPHGNLVILTGAGISAESGVPTFRASDGLWEGHRIEEVATPEGFAANPALVQDFYNQRRRQLAEVRPNAAHVALAELAARGMTRVLVMGPSLRAGSSSAALARALLKKRIDDEFAVELPGGLTRFAILDVSYDSN